MVAASRLAEHFDGYVAGNPGFNLPQAAVTHAWDIQALLEVNDDLALSITRGDMDLVANRVINVCDKLDGLNDGMVNNISACQERFKVKTLQCPVEGRTGCLGEIKIHALEKLFQGPLNSKGEHLYSNRPYDAGINGNGWRSWIIEGPINGLPIIAVMGAGSLANVFTTPPTMTAPDPRSMINFLKNFDLDTDAPRIYATNNDFTESPMEFMTPPDAEMMTGLVEHNGKMIVYHGASDPVFSVADTMDWYTKLDANHTGGIDNNVRLFSVPGMNHCQGGPSTDQFDVLGAIVDWVENDITPERIIASVNAENPELPENWSTERTRPLCPYPFYAKYNGNGDKEDADSFSCVSE